MGCLDIVRYIRGLRTKPNGERFTQTEKLAVVAIAVHQNSATGTAWPSLTELAAYALVTRGTLLHALATLKTAGLVEIEPRFRADGGQRSSCYRLTGLGVGAPSQAAQERGGGGGASTTPPVPVSTTPPVPVSTTPPVPVSTTPPVSLARPIRTKGKDQEERTKGRALSLSTAAAGGNDGPIVVPGAAPPERESAPPARTAFAEDERNDGLAEALDAACGSPATASERACQRRAVGELRAAGARPEEVAQRAQEARRRWQRGRVTPTALVNHWGSLGHAAGPRRPSAVMAEQSELERVGGLAAVMEAMGWGAMLLPPGAERGTPALPPVPLAPKGGGGGRWIGPSSTPA